MIDESDPRLVAMLASYARITGEPLCARGALFEAPFPVLAHGTESPPVFFYGNRAALTLWERSWDEWVRMPSRESAEPDAREVREAFLARVRSDGFSKIKAMVLPFKGCRDKEPRSLRKRSAA